jgi:hypothetical protein
MAACGDFIELALLLPSLLEREFFVPTLAKPTQDIAFLHAFDHALLGSLTLDAYSLEFPLECADLFSKAPPVRIERLQVMCCCCGALLLVIEHASAKLLDCSL